jgi:pilus assembly protein CpaB
MQNRRALIFFGLAILFGIAAAFTARTLLEDRASVAAQTTTVSTVPVVVARTDVSVGSALVALQLDTVEWPRDYVPTGAFDDPAKLTGRVVRRPLARGEAVLEPTLLPVGSAAGLPSVIESAKRAVSVKVDAVVSVAGFVTPGTRVDVLSTLRRLDSADKVPYTKVILQDLAVLAIDQKLEQAKNGEPQLVSVVTLEVTPRQSEELTYAAHEGRLQLALRGPGDHEEVKTQAVNASTLLGGEVPRKGKVRAPAGPSVQVITGSSVSVKSF